MKRNMFTAAVLAAAMALGLAGCGFEGGQTGGEASGGRQEGVRQEGAQQEGSQAAGGGSGREQKFTSYFDSEPTTFDPSKRTDTYSSTIFLDCMEGLIRIQQKNGGYEIAPGDAESWEVSDDGIVYTFHLGGDRKWSDGEPVTAQQYEYGIKRTADPATGSPNTYFCTPLKNYSKVSNGELGIDELGVRAVDDHTLEITLEAPMPSFINSVDGSIFYPQRQDKVEEWGDKFGTDVQYTVWNGPFTVTEWVHNSSITEKKNPNYWDAANVSLETVEWQIIPDIAAVQNAFDAGQIDLINVSSQEALMKYQGDESLKYTQTTGGNILFSFYNCEDEIFSNLNIRKAFSLALDQDDLNEMGYSGLRKPLYGWIPGGMTVDGKNFRQEAGDPILDMKAALAAEGKTPADLLAAGMEELGLGSDPAAFDVTFTLAGTSDWHHTFGEYLQQTYKESLGIDLKIEFCEWAIFNDKIQNKNYQIGYMSWEAYFDDPYDLLSLTVSHLNQIYSYWVNGEYDELVTGASHEMVSSKRLEMYKEAEQILLNEFPACPVADTIKHTFTKGYVHDKYAEFGEPRLFFSHPGNKNLYIE